MDNSGGSSPFLENPESKDEQWANKDTREENEKDAQIKDLQYKLSTLQNVHELEIIKLQREINSWEIDCRSSMESLEKALNENTRLVALHRALDEEIQQLKTQQNNGTTDLEVELDLLRDQLRTNNLAHAEEKERLEIAVDKLNTEISHYKMESEYSQSLLTTYENEINKQSETIQQLQKILALREDELAALHNDKLMSSHQKLSSTEELKDLTFLNKNLQEQRQYSKQLEETNLKLADELQKLRAYASKNHQVIGGTMLDITSPRDNFGKDSANQNEPDVSSRTDQNMNSEDLGRNRHISEEAEVMDSYLDGSKMEPDEISKEHNRLNTDIRALLASNLKLENDVKNLKILNDELALERNQLLELNKSFENNILNLKKLNHEIEQQKILSFEESQLLKNEIEMLKSKNQCYGDSKNDKRGYDHLVESYRNQTEDLTNELKKLNDQLISTANNEILIDNNNTQKKRRFTSDQVSLNYSKRLNELELTNLALKREAGVTNHIISDLESKLQKLKQLKEKKIRVLQLRDNPLQQDQFIKKQQLHILQEEVKSLWNKLEKRDLVNDSVPVAVVESLRFELTQAKSEAQKTDKRFQRLKEVYNKKSLEFIDAVNSLLGFKLEFQQSGKIKAVSCFQPDKYLTVDLNNNTLKSNLYSVISDWDTLHRCWVDDRQQIPCFLAAITLELWKNQRHQ